MSVYFENFQRNQSSLAIIGVALFLVVSPGTLTDRSSRVVGSLPGWVPLAITLAGCATASTTAKTAEATGRYPVEIDRSNDQSSDR